MTVELKPQEELNIGGSIYVVQPDPDPLMASKRPYIELGGSAQVFQLLSVSNNEYYALKVFNKPDETLVKKTETLKKNKVHEADGVKAARRTVINPKESPFANIVAKHPSLQYSALMPWIGGFTWVEILADNKSRTRQIPPFSRENSLFYALQLARSLSSLEKKGYAHCDMCSNNIILDFKDKSVQLIDLEDMYFPNGQMTQGFIGGQPGYAHPNNRSSRGHQWTSVSDRFGGGLLISEILTWHNPNIREASSDASFADPAELCKDINKYALMEKSLMDFGNKKIVALFDRLWKSSSLEDCPSLHEWENQVERIVEESESTPIIKGLSGFEADGRIRVKRKPVSLTSTPIEDTPKTARRRVDFSHSQPTPKPSTSLPGFNTKTDWGKVAMFIFIALLLVGLFIAFVTVVGTGIYISNTPYPSTSVIRDAATAIIIPSFTARVIPTVTSKPTQKPTQRPTQKPSQNSLLTCSEAVLSLSDTNQGDVVHVKPCGSNEYDMPAMAKGAYALGPNKAFIVYAGNDGMLYAAKIGVDSWYVVENLRKTGEFSAFYKNETPRFSISFSGDGVPYWVTIYEAMFSQSATIQIPLKISQ